MSSLKKDEINFNIKKDSHGWIQWKGTNVCIDINCKCGKQSHFDGDFMYYIQCPYCKQIYEANGYIELIKIKDLEKDGYKIAEKDFEDLLKGSEI